MRSGEQEPVNDPIREQLIGYVLGALEGAEHQYVEQQLGTDPRWRQELEAVQRCLEPLAEAYHEHEPPPDLAQRACRFVSLESERLKVTRPRHAAGTRTGAQETPYGGEMAGRWRMADWVVLAGVCLVAMSLFFPALMNSRFSARLTYCQGNLRELGISLAQFSDTTQQRFLPAVPESGNRAFAGFYAPTLKDSGFLTESRYVICPEAAPARDAGSFRIPSTVEIDTASGDQILLLQREAGGSYAYTLGHMFGGRHVTPRNLQRAYFALMADAPSLEFGRFAIHGKGLNILYEDGHIEFVVDWGKQRAANADNPFCNRMGRVEAGMDINDAVVAPSYCPPTLKNTTCGN
jgi:hypothetical protein